MDHNKTVPPERRNGAQQKKLKSQSVQQSAARILRFQWHEAVETILKLGEPPIVMLVGEPGVGKTTFALDAARELTGKSPVVLSGSPELEQHHVWGRWNLVGKETVFSDGPLPGAIKSGKHLIIEEFSQISIECRSAFLPLRDQKQITNPLNGEVLVVPDSFRVIATSNSESLSCRANREIARVLYDGIYIIECGDLSDQQASQLLAHHFPQSTKRRRNQVIGLWNEYRDFAHECEWRSRIEAPWRGLSSLSH